MSQTTRASTPVRSSGLLRAVQVTSVLGLLVLLFQGASAGGLLSGGAVTAHSVGAVVTHVLLGLATVAVFLHQRATAGPAWPTVLAALVFVVSFGQAALGSAGNVLLHVPLAVVLVVGATWLVAWAFSGARR